MFKYDQKRKTLPDMNAETLTRSILRKNSSKGKCYNDFFVHIMLIFLSLPRRINFTTMSRYSEKVESTYRNNFSKPHEMATFNLALIKELSKGETFWVFDPTYIPKSGKKTHGLDKFWSGCDQKAKWGLELGGIAAIDTAQHTALHYKAIQTPAFLADGETRCNHYAKVISEEKDSMQTISKLLVCDGWFSKINFVNPMVLAGFELISKLRSDGKLRYLYAGEQKGGKGKNKGKGKGKGGGKPKTYDGYVNPLALNPQYFTPCYQDENEFAYEAVVYSDSLERKVRLVVIHTFGANGKIKKATLLFSTNLDTLGMDIVYYYHLRYQIEFVFRDAKGFTGLNDCQARSKEKIDYHVNASLTAVNVAKAAHYYTDESEDKVFSMADIKTMYFNELLLNEAVNLFISEFGLNPNMIKNSPKIQELYNRGRIVA